MESIITQVERPDSAETNRQSQNQSQSGQNQTQNQSQPRSVYRSRSAIGKFLTSCCCCCRKRRRKHVEEKFEKVEVNKAEEGVDSRPVPIDSEPTHLLLPPTTQEEYKIVMVIDLDETLVHSSFKPIENPDFIVPVEIDGQVHSVYVLKRPFVDEFLKRMGQLYECVLFTASLAKYADPVADLLDQWGVFKTRLFREACVFYRGNYVKDLNKLGRDLKRIIIIDNSPASYIFHPDNAVPVASWFDDSTDTELLYLIPFFERLATVENVYTVLRNSNHPFNLSQPTDRLFVKDEKL